METSVLTFLLFILLLAVFLGLEMASRVPDLLREPLISGTNAISGVAVLGGILAAGLAKGVGNNDFSALLGAVAVVLATINVVAGFKLTERMLDALRKKDKK